MIGFYLKCAVVTIAVYSIWPSQLIAQTSDLPTLNSTSQSDSEYVAGEVLVEWDTALQNNELLADRISVVEVSDVEQAINVLQLDSRVKQVEPNYKRYLYVEPDDVYYSSQLHLEQSTDADIDAAAAWDTTTGDRSIIVAVIDSGVYLEHPDLIDNIWTNPNEIASNGLDDDNNGYIDDTNGWDFIDDDNDPNPTPAGAYNTTYVLHGTHVAGIVGATGNNARGVTGVNWEVSIMPLRIFGDNGESSTSAIIDAIAYAQANGADILNMSYGSYFASDLEEQAMNDAYAAGLLSIAAAGNDTVNLNTLPSYPVCYDNVVGVAAVDETDAAAWFTNYGTDCVDLAAPGDNIFSTFYFDLTSDDFTEPYGWFSGTSMATPIVAGAAALLKSIDGSLEPNVMADILADSADSLSDDTLGSGRLNLASAMADLLSSGPEAVAITGYHTSDKIIELRSDQRTRDATPYFSWPKPDSVEDIAGYYVYFGKDRLNPVTAGTFQTERDYEPSPIHGNEKKYRLRVKAVDEDAISSPLTQFVYLVDTKIKRPTWNSIKRIDNGVQLRWHRPKQEHTLGYFVYRSINRSGPFRKMTNYLMARRLFIDTAVQSGQTYYYRVRAVDDLGNESTLSKIRRIAL